MFDELLKLAAEYQKLAQEQLEKLAYFQGGGGVNEPTPKKKKYKSEPALVMQPRFKEPLYRNYDLYETEGVDGPAKHGPGAGMYQNMHKYKSVSDFLDKKRERNKDKYKADDSWKQDDGSITKKNPGIKARAELLNKIVKLASVCQDSDIEYSDKRDAFFCKKCFHMGPNAPTKPVPTAKELHASKNHNPGRTDWSNCSDVNHIDFPIDEFIGSGPILGDSGTVSDSVPIGGQLDEYLTNPDFEGKSPDKLDFGRDYTEESGPARDQSRSLDDMLTDLDAFVKKPLSPKETDLMGTPQGISPPEDIDSPSDEDPDYGITDSGNTFYNKSGI